MWFHSLLGWKSPACPCAYPLPLCLCVILHVAARVIFAKLRSGHCKLHIHCHHHSCDPSVLPCPRPPPWGSEEKQQTKVQQAWAALPSLILTHPLTGLNFPTTMHPQALPCPEPCAHSVPSAWDTLPSPLPYLSSCSSFSSQLKGHLL